jgi:lipopolysaccharide export system protein LptA
VLVSLGVAAAASADEEARAATRLPAVNTHSTPGPESLLGALSLTASRDPISVSADVMEFDYRVRVLTYKGSVVVTQGDMKLESNSLTVALDEQPDGRIKEVVADGQVRLSKGARWATGGHAVFDQARNIVVLSDNAEVHDGPNRVSGDRVVVYLNEERSVVEGGNHRVTAELFPSHGNPTPGGIP